MVAMNMNISAILFVCLVLVVQVAIGAKQNARLRGKHFEALEEMARNPQIDEHIRGKTLKDLGIEQSLKNKEEEQQARRKIEGIEIGDTADISLKYFSVYDEFVVSPLTTLGETAGSRGMIYDTRAKDEGLLEEHVEGALQGTCSLVQSDGKQLCSFEFFLINPDTGALGTVVATGTVKNQVDTNSVLIVEATGDELIGYKGGMVIIKYTAIGEQTVMDLELALTA